MASLTIREYHDLPQDRNSRSMPMPKEPAIAVSVTAIDASSREVPALNSLTRFVRIKTDAACNLMFTPEDTEPVASLLADGGADPWDAGHTEFRAVDSRTRIAVIAE